MAVQAPEPQIQNELDNELKALSRRAIRTDVKDIPAAIDLARAFEEWASRAAPFCGEWCGTFQRQAQEVIAQLRSGDSTAKGIEQLLRFLLQANRFMEKERKGKREKDGLTGDMLSKPPEIELVAPEDQHYVRPEDTGLFQMFVQEAPAFLTAIQTHLMSMSTGQRTDLNQLHQLFRVFQGQWAFLGFLHMAGVCAKSQSLLECFLTAKAPPTAEALDVLLMALGACRSQTDRIARGLPQSRIEVWDASYLLEEMANREGKARESLQASQITEKNPIPMEEGKLFRISEEQLDDLLELFGDLNLSQVILLEETPGAPLKGKGATEAAKMAKLTRQMRDLILSFRMTSIQPLFEKLKREIDLLSRRSGKPVALTLEGERTEVDQQLLPVLFDLMVQLLRNAFDHGFETTQERAKAGKPMEGALRIKASQQMGSIVMEVDDDGRGLDMEKLMEKGRALGILREEKVSQSRIMEMIFKAGVTTLDNPEGTRGVGLDQVESQVESFHGSIRVQNRSGQGCKFILRLPKTQALIEGWVVEADGKRYLLPLSQVRKVTHPTPQEKKRLVRKGLCRKLIWIGGWERSLRRENPNSQCMWNRATGSSVY